VPATKVLNRPTFNCVVFVVKIEVFSWTPEDFSIDKKKVKTNSLPQLSTGDKLHCFFFDLPSLLFTVCG